MSPAQKRKREKVGRYDPKLMQALRTEIAKHPNPMFGRMLADGRMSDSDVLDFSLTMAHSYFSGDLLEPVVEAAQRELERLTRQTLLKTAALFGMTATFEKDGGAILKSAWSEDDPDAQTAAIQALVDTGLSVKEAMAAFKTGPPEGGNAPIETIRTQLPEAVVVVH